MAKKIPFNVVFVSDEDQSFPGSELNIHGPTVHGWRSAPDSRITPHDIVLRFQKPAKIFRIQILAHQYLIPEKVEVWIHYSPKGIPSTPSSQSFDYLGFISLSDNAATNYKSRELQSVTVSPRRGTHLKLRLSEAYKNDFNPKGQIALIAVNVLGEDLETASSSTESATLGDGESEQQPNINGNEIGNGAAVETSLASICDDLLFSMYVEESMANYIREMEMKKAKAVSDERFEYARKLKLCMTALRTAGERLGRYALAKKFAVQEEDFTTAKLRKEQFEIYRSAVLKHLLVDDLLELNGPIDGNDVTSSVYASKPVLPEPPSLQDVAHALTEAHMSVASSPKSTQDDRSSADGASSIGYVGNSTASSISVNDCSSNAHLRKSHDELPMSPHMSAHRSRHSSPMSSRQSSLRRRNKSAPRNSYEDYEERAIPALRQECQGTALLEADPNRGRSRLNDRERRQAAMPILVFGNDLVELFYSRQFQDREDGLMRLRSYLKDFDPTTALNEQAAGANKVARSATLLLHRAVRDAVYSVFNQATETVRTLFLEFVPGLVSQSEVSRCVDRLLPELLAKSGDPSARIHTLAQHTILSIASCPEVAEQHLIAPALSRAVSSGTHPRLALSRMQMLEQLVLSQGINNDKHSGLSCRSLSECGCSGLHHPAEPVRKVAERILLLVYKINPRLVRKQLPPDDDITRRNLLYRQLFTEFDKLDLERKQELLETNKHSGHTSSSDPNTSPSLKLRQRRDRTDDDHYGNDGRSSPCRFSSKSPDPQVLSAKHTADIQDGKTRNGQSLLTELTTNTNNGYGSLTCNGKQQYNEQLKQLMSTSSSRKGSQSNSHSDSLEDSTPDMIRCPFCDWSHAGNDQGQLDRHYWKSCPFLTKCPQCSQVVEVAALNYHLINECEAKESFISCDRCSASVHKQLLELHQMEDYCRALKSGAGRCPLCHDDVHLPLDGGWKLHLLSTSGCPGNTRRRTKQSN